MSATGKGSNSELIYIVDDEALLGQLAETVLTEAGFRTRTFLDPVDALRAVRDEAERPDVLVTDFVMGSMTGIELIEGCKACHPKLRTILLSGTVNETEVSTHDTQPDLFIPKPYRVGAFVKSVIELIKSQR
jgi:two-component system, cell cycle sensor histidine kinase and response regulator CckA